MDTSELFRYLAKVIIHSKGHGFQGKLAKKCDIEPKYFSECLNSSKTKLSETKRIAVVEELGYEYDEFLYLAKKGVQVGEDGKLRPSTWAKKVQRIYSRACDVERVSGDMLERFNNKKLARLCIDKLIEVDGIRPAKLKWINNYLSGILQGLEPDGDPEEKPEIKTGTESK